MTDESIGNQALQIIEATLADGRDLHAYVLIDGALLQARAETERERWPAFAGLSLLTDADGETKAVGPLLHKWRPESDHEHPDIVWPASSVIVSTMTQAELAAHLVPMLDVQLDQMESTMLMRFFDPRVLPFWLDTLPAEHRAYLALGVHAWIHEDAERSLRARRIEVPPSLTKAVEFPLQLSQQQENDLLAACYPYTVVERLRGEYPALMEKLPEARHYGFVRDQLDRCHAHGVDSPAALFIYCGLALRYGARFDEHPNMAPVFAALAEGLDLAQALTRVSPGGWKSMQEDAV